MPKKTIALIIGLVLVTIILFVIALNNTNQKANPQPGNEQMGQKPEPSSVAHTVLTMSPASVSVVPGKQNSLDVIMNTSGNAVTAVQLELQYDPTQLGNITVTPGPLFSNPVVLINTNNTKIGRLTYAFGIQPNQQTISGTGTVATITFTGKGKIGTRAQLEILPTSLVTARGVATSVLKSSTGAIIDFIATQPLTSVSPLPSVANAAVSPVVTIAPTVAGQ